MEVRKPAGQRRRGFVVDVVGKLHDDAVSGLGRG